MSKLYYATFLLLFTAVSQKLSAQFTLILQPDSGIGKDALIQMRNSDPLIGSSNYGSDPNYEAVAWTWNLDPGLTRSLLSFDLSGLPAGAILQGAQLSLYNNPTSSENNGEHSSLSGSNSSVLQLITDPWDEFTVTWDNQPGTTTANQVHLAQSTTVHEDYLNIDVTNLLGVMIADPANAHGFMIRLDDETYYRSIIFASSDHVNPNFRPKLEITYVLESVDEITDNSLISVSPNPGNGTFYVNFTTAYRAFTILKVEDALGQLVYLQNISSAPNRLEVVLPDVAKGVYVLSLSGKEKRSVKKLVVD